MTGSHAYRDASDEELAGWSGQGDRRAFDEIVTRHGPFALRVAGRIIPDRLIAEDIVQEAMLRAWTQAARFDPERAQFRTWLYRIIVNLCIDHRRRIQPAQLPEDYDVADPSDSAEELVAATERNRDLLAALGSLPPRQRAAMTLVYDEGLSGAEAGRMMGLSAKAIERLLARARVFLRDRVQRPT